MRILSIITVLAIVILFVGCGENKPEAVEVKKEHRIMDDAELLTPVQEDSIFTIIQGLESTIGSQIAVLTIGSLSGESIESFSLRIVEKMKLGREMYDDGVLITVALTDRKMKIDVGYGLEKIIGDEVAARIIREDMTPRFQKGDFFNGIKTAVEKIRKLIEENRQLVGERP